MSRSSIARAGLAVALAAALVGCGKKGNPLPPLRPVPARIADLAATRTAEAVELRFTVPAANLDGTTPVAIDRVDVYGLRAASDAPAPPVSQVVGDPQHLLGRVTVGERSEDAASGSAAASALPGQTATFVDALSTTGEDVTRYYSVVPVAGSGRGRPGPPAALVAVPMGDVPAAPRAVSIDYDETTVLVTWEAAETSGDSLQYRVFDAASAAGPEPTPLTPEPIATSSFTAPVEFGRDVCVTVRAYRTTGPVSVVSRSSDVVCATPVDRYPPPAPSGLRVVQEGTTVVLVWDAVAAADLAGYIVLRGDGLSVALTPLVREPIEATTYRDRTAVAGATYTYAVYAVDSAPAANAGPTSEHQTLTVR